ncbi:preprotein translocase subunit SecG [Candidatus Peregrinibacteria bacterium CG_4_10_14_0_2_um_filter_38_24]|nr:MAG: preprotein translocase subunit SecG [Candidatus Peregrinibacteria bacterium CG_4_10_14_0_2_um_filter_38_24]PJC39256.1 MAG: preprotein translocase subunit SecG [Candidatus Peregrinibacteria bacterium CG_4_9_14_0_2_um_filter_38_9]
MQTILTTVQIVLSILLSVAILTQQRGTGLSSTFGGSGTFYTSKRGAEKVLFHATIVLGILFVANSIVYLFFV